MYIVKITGIMPYIDNNFRNANINPREIVNFRKFAKIYTRKNIYVHSIASIASLNDPLILDLVFMYIVSMFEFNVQSITCSFRDQFIVELYGYHNKFPGRKEAILNFI